MREFLRKYGKAIMTVLSVALMFIFALPTFRNKTAEDVRGARVATMDGQKITGGQLQTAQYELGVLRQLRLLPGQQWPYPSFQFPQTSILFINVEESDQAAYWLMLCHEAGKYAKSFMSYEEAAASAAGLGLSSQDVEEVIQSTQINHEMYVDIVRRLQSVETYVRMVLDVPQPVSQLELLGDRAMRKALVTFTNVDGTSGWQSAAAPTEEQIKAQFEAYKSQVAPVLPKEPRKESDGQYNFQIAQTEKGVVVTITQRGGKTLFNDVWSLDAAKKAQLSDDLVRKVQLLALPGPEPKEINGHHYPFGYKYPDRVRVEWLELKRSEVRAKVPKVDDDELKAYQFVKENPDKVREMLTAAGIGQPATAPAQTAPSTQTASTATAPASTLPSDIPSLYKLARTMLLDAQIDTRTDALMKRMLDQITTRAAVPWKNATPEPAAWVPYESMAKSLSETPDFNGYMPQYGNCGRLMDATELSELPGIGDSFAMVSQRQVPFANLAVNVKEVATLDKDNLLSRLNLQVGAEGQPLKDAEGNVYIYRVVAADKSHEPAGLDETVKPGVTVKSQVVDDLKKLKTYETRLQEVKDAATKSTDIAQVAGQFKTSVRMPEAFSRLQADNGQLPLDAAGIRGFADHAFTLKAPADGAKPSIEVFEDNSHLMIEAMSLAKYLDATGLDFARARMEFLMMPDPQVGRLERSMLGGALIAPGPFAQKYFDIETLAARVHYQFENREGFKKKK